MIEAGALWPAVTSAGRHQALCPRANRRAVTFRSNHCTPQLGPCFKMKNRTLPPTTAHPPQPPPPARPFACDRSIERAARVFVARHVTRCFQARN